MTEVHTTPHPTSALSRSNPPPPDANFRNRPFTSPASVPQADQLFLGLVDAFQATGGLIRVDDLESMFMLRSFGFSKEFAMSITDRQVIHFEWQAQTWLPLFQFDLIRMQARPELVPILAELNSIYDNWEVADWFARINPWLGGYSPSQELGRNPLAVMNAASAEVFVARG